MKTFCVFASTGTLRAVAEGRVIATTSAEVVQEILHRFVAIQRPAIGADMAREVMTAFAPVLPITHAIVERMPELMVRYPSLTARDLIHVATCMEEGIDVIVSPDRGFDAVTEIRRLDPSQVAGTG